MLDKLAGSRDNLDRNGDDRSRRCPSVTVGAPCKIDQHQAFRYNKKVLLYTTTSSRLVQCSVTAVIEKESAGEKNGKYRIPNDQTTSTPRYARTFGPEDLILASDLMV